MSLLPRAALVALIAAGIAPLAAGQGSLSLNPSVDVEAAEWSGSVLPGRPEPLLVTVTNRAASPDSFRVSASAADAGWAVLLPVSSTGTLAPSGSPAPIPDPADPTGDPLPSSVELNLTVLPSPQAWAGQRVAITVDVESTNSTSSRDTLVVEAVVAQVYGARLACMPGRVTLPAGHFVLLRVEAANRGNGADEFRLAAEPLPGLSVSFARDEVLLGAGASDEVAVNVSAAPGLKPGLARLELAARSLRGDAADSCLVDVVLQGAPGSREKSRGAPGFEALAVLVALAAFVALSARRR